MKEENMKSNKEEDYDSDEFMWLAAAATNLYNKMLDFTLWLPLGNVKHSA